MSESKVYEFGRDLRVTVWMHPGRVPPGPVNAMTATREDLEQNEITQWCDAFGVETVRVDRPLTFRIGSGTPRTNATTLGPGERIERMPGPGSIGVTTSRPNADVDRAAWLAALRPGDDVEWMALATGDWYRAKVTTASECGEVRIDLGMGSDMLHPNEKLRPVTKAGIASHGPTPERVGVPRAADRVPAFATVADVDAYFGVGSHMGERAKAYLRGEPSPMVGIPKAPTKRVAWPETGGFRPDEPKPPSVKVERDPHGRNRVNIEYSDLGGYGGLTAAGAHDAILQAIKSAGLGDGMVSKVEHERVVAALKRQIHQLEIDNAQAEEDSEAQGVEISHLRRDLGMRDDGCARLDGRLVQARDGQVFIDGVRFIADETPAREPSPLHANLMFVAGESRTGR
jgi:hypothetical protein